MYDQSKLSELIRFARVDAGSTVIDVYPGDGDWTRLFLDFRQILEEKARPIEQYRQRTVMIRGQGIDPGLDVGEILQE